MIQQSTDIWTQLDLRKTRNAFQLISSYYASRLGLHHQPAGLPWHITIEPTTACNLRCPECPSGLRSFTRPTGKMDLALYQSVVDDISWHTLFLYLYFQGEPFLHPRFFDMISYARQKKLFTVTSTNGHFLNNEQAEATVASGLHRLIISVDGIDQTSYASYRIQGKLSEVLEGTGRILAWKKKTGSRFPQVVWQMLVVKPNEHQIPAFFELAKSYGVDEAVLKTAQVYDYEQGHSLIPTQTKYARYIQGRDGRYRMKYALENHCWKMWHSSVITWDGKVLPCCFDKDARYVMGRMQEQTFEHIWKDAPYRDFRKRLMKSRSEIDICKNCSEGTRVWVGSMSGD